MKIKVLMDVSEMKRHTYFSLDDLGLTKKEWDELDDGEKQEVIQKAVDDEPNQPYWIVDTFETRD